MGHQFHFVRMSSNAKLGGIPATTTSGDSCPSRCSFRDGNGCYGEAGPLFLHWREVNARKRGGTLAEFCRSIKSLPKHQLWRHNQVGDLPGDGVTIDAAALAKIVRANTGKHGFTFTHYDPTDPDNAEAIRQANDSGFTVNLSAESLEEVDQFLSLGVGPVVVALPADADKPIRTRAGNRVTICPASLKNTTCAQCGMCAEPDRKHAIGFPSHGSGKAKVERVFWAKQAAAL